MSHKGHQDKVYDPTKSSNKDYVSWPVFLKGGLIQDTGQTNDKLTFNQNSNIIVRNKTT